MKKILIIEDEVDLREALQTQLIHDGYFVKTAETSQEGLQLVIDDVPDLILLDVMTHSMHAAVFLERLRNLPNGKSIKVIVLTNLDNDITREKVQSFGIEEYLVKSETPLSNISELVKKVFESMDETTAL